MKYVICPESVANKKKMLLIIRDGPVNLVGGEGGGGEHGEWKNDFCAIYFASIKGLQFFFIVIFSEGEGGGGLKLGIYVFHHNNNFNLISIYSAKFGFI